MTATSSDEAIYLAKALLEIAELAMPETFFRTDRRCARARETLAAAGYPADHDPDPADSDETASPPGPRHNPPQNT